MRMIDADTLLDEFKKEIAILKDTPAKDDYDKGIMQGYKEAIMHLKAAPTLTPPNKWVSVENALPPTMDDVLMVVQNNGECWTVTGYYSNTSNVWYAMLNGQDTLMDVLWWMPLPAPPGSRLEGGEQPC